MLLQEVDKAAKELEKDVEKADKEAEKEVDKASKELEKDADQAIKEVEQDVEAKGESTQVRSRFSTLAHAPLHLPTPSISLCYVHKPVHTGDGSG